jgi:hypothetical protein
MLRPTGQAAPVIASARSEKLAALAVASASRAGKLRPTRPAAPATASVQREKPAGPANASPRKSRMLRESRTLRESRMLRESGMQLLLQTVRVRALFVATRFPAAPDPSARAVASISVSARYVTPISAGTTLNGTVDATHGTRCRADRCSFVPTSRSSGQPLPERRVARRLAILVCPLAWSQPLTQPSARGRAGRSRRPTRPKSY